MASSDVFEQQLTLPLRKFNGKLWLLLDSELGNSDREKLATMLLDGKLCTSRILELRSFAQMVSQLENCPRETATLGTIYRGAQDVGLGGFCAFLRNTMENSPQQYAKISY